MRIVFIGCVEFSAHCLKEVLNIGGNVVLVVTRGHRKFIGDWADLRAVTPGNIPLMYTDNINDKAVVEEIRAAQPDFIFCFGWSQLIKKEILGICPVVGAHPALLPHNRGRHPIIWAIILGLGETGLTFFMMTEGADTGDILSQESMPIFPNDTARDLYNRVKESASQQIPALLENLEKEQPNVERQNSLIGNSWRKRTDADSIIDWRMSGASIVRLVNALSEPYPGAMFGYKGKIYRVDTAEVLLADNENDEHGKVLLVGHNRLVVACGDGDAVQVKGNWPNIEIQKGEYL